MNANTYLTIQEIQDVEYSILCKVIDFFSEHNIRYILGGGTMLGAVRHNGFIPWDDDIDVLVPRDDYDRFITLIKKERNAIPGITVNVPGDKNSFYPFIKATNTNYEFVDNRFLLFPKTYLWIDVFPLDHFPDDKDEYAKWLRRILFFKNVLYSGILTQEHWKTRNKSKKAKLKHIIRYSIYRISGGYSKVSKIIDSLARHMNNKYIASNHVGDGAWPEKWKDYFPVSATFPTMKHIFVDREFEIPVDYDAYLSKFYGDYMTPPPENQRNGHHIKVYYVGETKK